MKRLSNGAIQPILLKRHLETNHANKMNGDQSYLQQIRENVKRQRIDKTGEIQQKVAKIVMALYEAAFSVVKHLKVYWIAESFVMPAAKSWLD